MASKRIKFAQLHKTMVYSKAFQDLNAPSLKILSYLLLQLRWVKIGGRKKRYEIANVKEIKLLYSTFRKKPFYMNPNTITRSIDSLLEHGFIKVQKQGGRVKGDESIYSYSNSWESWEKGKVYSTRRPFAKRGFTIRHTNVVNI